MKIKQATTIWLSGVISAALTVYAFKHGWFNKEQPARLETRLVQAAPIEIKQEPNQELLELRSEVNGYNTRLFSLEEEVKRLGLAFDELRKTPYTREQTRSDKDSYVADTEQDRWNEMLLAFRSLRLNEKTGLDVEAAKLLYTAGMTEEDLERLAEDMQSVSHVAEHMDLTPKAQANMVQAYDTYQDVYMKGNGMSPSQIAGLAKSSPSAYTAYSTGKWDMLKVWFQTAAPQYISYQQQASALAYLFGNTAHLEQSIQEDLAKASSN